MGCAKEIVDAGLCPEAEAKKKQQANKLDPLSCTKAKNYIDLALQREEKYYLSNGKFGNFGQIGLGFAPNPNDYTYRLDYVGNNYVKISAEPKNQGNPYIVGYCYLQEIGQHKVVRKISQVSKSRNYSSLITSDVAQTRVLTQEAGFSNHC